MRCSSCNGESAAREEGLAEAWRAFEADPWTSSIEHRAALEIFLIGHYVVGRDLDESRGRTRIE
jgi:hypothetical protein